MSGVVLYHWVLLLVVLVGADQEHTARTRIVAQDVIRELATPLDMPNKNTEPIGDIANSVRTSASAQPQATSKSQPKGGSRTLGEHSLRKSRVDVGEPRKGSGMGKAPVSTTRYANGHVFNEQLAKRPIETATNRPMGKSLETIAVMKGDRADETTEDKRTVVVGRASDVHGPGAVQPAVITNLRSMVAKPQKAADPNVHLRPRPAYSARKAAMDIEQGHATKDAVPQTRGTIVPATHPATTHRTRETIVANPKAMMVHATPSATNAMPGHHLKPMPRVKQHRPGSLSKPVLNATAVKSTDSSIRVQARTAPRKLIPKTKMSTTIQNAPVAGRHSLSSTVKPAVFEESLNVTPSHELIMKEKKMVMKTHINRAQRPLQTAEHKVWRQPEIRHQLSDERRVASARVRPSASLPGMGHVAPSPASSLHNAVSTSKQQLDRTGAQSRIEVQGKRVISSESKTATASKEVVDEKRLQSTKPMHHLRKLLSTTSPTKASTHSNETAAIKNRPADPVLVRIPTSKGHPLKASLPSIAVLGGRPQISHGLPVPAIEGESNAPRRSEDQVPQRTAPVTVPANGTLAGLVDGRPHVKEILDQENKSVSTAN